MMKKMRRKNQELSREETLALFERNTGGVLSLCGSDGQPYGVPLNYAQDDDGLYFHWAKDGFKLDLARENNKASFTVIDADEIIGEKYTSAYRSGIIFGRLSFLEGEEAYHAMKLLIEKYSSDQPLEEKEMKAHCKGAVVVRLSLDEVTGKKGKETV